MENIGTKGQKLLIEKVIDKGICVTCGACVGLCPYFDYYDGKVLVMDICNSNTWRCLQFCPQAGFEDTNPTVLSEKDAVDWPIGKYKKILIARAKNVALRKQVQYGGIVSAILGYALEEELIESAVLTDKGNEGSPQGIIAHDREDILRCAGSRYTASAGLSALNKGIKSNKKNMAVVGLPCQMEAMARMRLMIPDGAERDSHIKLKIGLFCTWALDYRRINKYLNKIGLRERIIKYDIPPPPSQTFRILLEKTGWMKLSLDDIRPFIQKGCALCEDMTAELSDISVGAVEGKEGWNTVIARSETGAELIDSAAKKNIIETDALPEANLVHLKDAALNKKRKGRAVKEDFGLGIS